MADAVADLSQRRGRAAGGWSLDPTRALLAHVGNPHDTFAAVHVGGTNGKGSVATLLAAALQSAGWRVGLYTSPHLVHVRERMVVNGRPIDDDAFVTWANRLHPIVESTGASFFEATTAIAFADFAARGVAVAVVEVGLGGRLDATNVITPLAAVVTNVTLEHQDYLGDSLEAIAREKSGIAKSGMPFVIGERDARVAAYLERGAAERGAVVTVVAPDTDYQYPLGLAGPHQRWNARVAAATLGVLPAPFRPAAAAVRDGFARAWLPARFDRRGRWIFDVAHNPAGVATLVTALEQIPPRRPLHVLFGALGDKDGRRMVQRLGGVADRLWLTIPPDAPVERRGDPTAWAAGAATAVLEPRFDRAFEAASRNAATVLVTGSFHTVGAALARLPGFTPFG